MLRPFRAVLAGLVLFALPAFADFCAEQDSLSLGGSLLPRRPNQVIAVDVDGDGVLDLVTVNDATDDLSVVLALGAGAFASPVHWATGNGPVSIAAGDVDGDLDVDLVSANKQSNDLRIHWNDGNENFSASTSIPVGPAPDDVLLLSLDGNDYADLAVTLAGDSTVAVLRGLGGGVFADPELYWAGNTPSSLVAGDLDRNGSLDLVVGNFADASVVRLMNAGDGSFGAPVEVPVGGTPYALAVGDFDGVDGPDLASVDGLFGRVYVLLNDGTGALLPEVDFAGATGAWDLCSVDLDCDGMMDVVSANLVGDDLSFFRNLGGAQFGPATSLPVRANPSSIAFGDLDGDDAPDLAVAESLGLSVGFNGCPSCSAVSAPGYTLSGLLRVEGILPNPFGAQSRIAFHLERDLWVHAQVVDLRGRLVRDLGSASLSAGSHAISWDGRDRHGQAAASGVYMIRLQTEGERHVRRVVLLR